RALGQAHVPGDGQRGDFTGIARASQFHHGFHGMRTTFVSRQVAGAIHDHDQKIVSTYYLTRQRTDCKGIVQAPVNPRYAGARNDRSDMIGSGTDFCRTRSGGATLFQLPVEYSPTASTITIRSHSTGVNVIRETKAQ